MPHGKCRQMQDPKVGAGTEEDWEPVRMRSTIGSLSEARAGICSSSTPPRFSTDDETVEPSSVDLIAPAPSRRKICRHASYPLVSEL